MFAVYILQNLKSNRYYIGSTDNIDRRLSEHNRGQTKSTRYAKNLWILVFKETFDTRYEAHRRELQIKSFKGGNAFKRLLRD